MKNLIPVFALIAITLFSCQKQASTKLAPQHFEDVVLQDKVKDEEVTRKIAARRKPCPPNNPNCQTPPQPPPTEAKGCILLDFNGQQVNDTHWGSFYCEPSGLSDAQIAEVLTRCRSYYSFNTALAFTSDESVFSTYPVNKRLRVITTTTMPSGYQGSGGVAYLNSFNWFEDTPAFVNSAGLQFNSKYVADANSHETGHGLALYHDVEVQYNADGSCYVYSPYLWGDLIMGASYYSASPRFDAAGPTGCGTTQNELSIVNNSVSQ